MSKRLLVSTLAAGVVVALLLVTITPFPRSLSSAPLGDQHLAEQVRKALDGGSGHHSLAAVRIGHGGSTAFTGFDATEDTEFEIGSVSKAFTSMLFADAVERGEVSPETTLGDVFGMRAGNGSAITLDDLASHRSGLPRLAPAGGLATAQSFLRTLLRLDPYTRTREDLLAGLTEAEPESGGEPEYSNYGAALLGMALEETTSTPYPDLLHERITAPLGITDTYVPIYPEGLPARAPAGHSASGLRAAPWTMGASAPAGGIRSTPHDMALWMSAVAAGDAPGQSAVEPRYAAGNDQQIGWAWFSQPVERGSGTLTWHNGMTGGFASFVGFIDGGEAIVVLADTALSVTEAARLLDGGPGSSEGDVQ